MVRAGWSGMKFSASKLKCSVSTSGPSATSQPMPTNTSAIRSDSVVSGCRAPRGLRFHGKGDVDGLVAQHALVAFDLQLARALLEGGLDLGLRLVDPLARVGTGLGRQRADLPARDEQRCLVTQVRRFDSRERVEVGRGGELLAGRVDGGLQRLRRERGDLLRVVRVVGSGHGWWTAPGSETTVEARTGGNQPGKQPDLRRSGIPAVHRVPGCGDPVP